MANDAQSAPAPRGDGSSTTLAANADSKLVLQSQRVRQQRSLWNNAWRQFRHHKLAMAGLVIFIAFVILTFIGPLFYHRPINAPFEYDSDQSPSLKNLLGTDSMGQDMLARVMFGGRISISVGLIAAFVAIMIGTLVGAASGFFGGFLDSVLMRLTDLFVALPQLPLLLLITFLFGQSMKNVGDRVFGSPTVGIFLLLVFVIGALAWMQTARIVRASFLSTKEKEFVEAARSIGATQSSLIFKQILPNVMSPIIVAATLEVGSAIITESSLSFLGLGFSSDVPTWGQMLFSAKDYLQLAPHEALIPGAMIFLTVLAINYMGDGLRDALDPRKTN
jgi:peptide/nickel transport system permease protein